ncbi:MAG: hypothetical protein AAB316_12405 [Bacteroidota bacterium]
METKKVLGTALIALGFIGLVPGVLGIFERQEYLGVSPWALVILGIVFFTSGVGLIQTVRGVRKTTTHDAGGSDTTTIVE